MSIIEKINGVWAETGTKESTLTDEKKSTGHAGGDFARTDRLNYLFNRDDVKIDEIIDYINVNANIINVCNWEIMLNEPAASNLFGVLYHPDIGRWLTYAANQEVYASVDAHQWIATKVHDLSYTANVQNCAIDLTRYLIANTNNDIEYSTDGDSTWATETDATIGGTGTIRRIATKYPDSSFTMLVRAADDIRIASTGIGGGWTAPTTPPDNTGKTASGLIYMGGTSWALIANLVNSCKVHVSTDDGDTWTAASYNPSFDIYGMRYNPDKGTVIVFGTKSGVGAKINRNNIDDIATKPWTTVTFLDDDDGPPTFTTSNVITDVIYCGNETWVAVGNAGTDLYGFWASRDDGVTWRFIYAHKQTTGEVLRDLYHIAKSENQLIVVGEGGRSMRTLSRADAFTF